MRVRSLLAATGTTALVLGTVFGGVAGAAPTARPTIYNVEVEQVANSTLAPDGGRPALIVAQSHSTGICSWDFQVYNGLTNKWTDLGTTTTNQIINNIPAAQLGYVRQYAATASDCSGHTSLQEKSPRFGPGSYNTTDTEPTVPCCYSILGPTTVVSNANAFHGDIQEVTGLGSRMMWNHESYFTYNLGVYGETGPQGGIGTVYFNGVKAGTINFYSKTLSHFRTLMFKDGSQDAQEDPMYIQMTSAGAGHGSTMYIDALADSLQ